MNSRFPVRVTWPLDDLVLLEHADPGGAPHGLPTNTYAVLAGDRALIVDASVEYLSGPLGELADAGFRPAALAFTHHHLPVNGDADFIRRFSGEFGIPVLMHRLDIAHPLAKRTGLAFTDVEAGSPLAPFGLEVLHFPGQTEGSVLFYRERDGLLLAGDSAMGPTQDQAGDGLRRLVRTPWDTSVDDEALRQNWQRFRLPVRHVAPLHGKPQFHQPDLAELMKPLVRAAATEGMTGEPAILP
ncbi:MBL fold metallo-hydrolase [Amycolatopsis nigrescens]|uniref:MBL fold metallo-hydrolase n=1 Tax=Amycolatopsis nigrescens TaxID=381445 RepID=UPI000369B400|nr:MBL fold metallo-hydrolase [Amycolatopsis nigrescens]